MKKSLLIFSLLLCLFSYGYGQRIQYSKGSFQVDDPNETQLVSNVNGYHHVLTFSYNRKPSIHVFNRQLQLLENKQLDYAIRKDCDVRILQFTDHYFIFLHLFKPSQFELWRIDATGNSVRISGRLNQVVDSFFRKGSASLQLVNVDGKLYALAQTYYDTIKSIRSTIIQLDENFVAQKKVEVLYPFDRSTELLQQTELTKDALFILKTTRDNQNGNSIDIVKIELATGELLTTTFSTAFQFHQNPGFTINKDSSILVYSILGRVDMNRRVQRSVLISRLDHQLHESSPVTLLKSQFRQNTSTNFLSIDGEPSWLSMYGNRRIYRMPYGSSVRMGNEAGINMPGIYYNNMDYNSNSYRMPVSVRFTILDSQFKIKTDSVAANDKKIIEVQSYPFGQFAMSGRSYLVLVQNFTAKRKGLLVMNSDENNNLVTTGLAVFDKYDYLLAQLQFSENYFIVPYTFKNEIGLMKVTVRQDQF